MYSFIQIFTGIHQVVLFFFFSSSRLVIPWRGDLRLTLSLKEENCNIQYLEHMQAEVNLLFPRRGYLEMFSTSPSGTRSKLLYSRKIDVLTGRKNLTDWRVTSLHYWGEKPFGNWNFTIRSARPWSNLGAGKWHMPKESKIKKKSSLYYQQDSKSRSAFALKRKLVKNNYTVIN